ncbi:PRC and DUF2382 domain-containing protein [Streptomyces sp. SDT5-1]|uniref:PRC and DUF2382 domain-containing protein n=1 Tax=Streptomyces sp. SDT5-1 TaxID=3406418 RepID=UPI003FD65E98
MTQSEINDPNALVGLTAYDRTGEKIGSVERVYLDDRTGKADWVTVKTGLFGMKETFVPLSGATHDGDRLNVRYTREAVKDAPRVDADQHLDESEKNELYRHYGMTRPSADSGTGRTGMAGTSGGASGGMSGGTAGTAGAAGTAGLAGAGAGAGAGAMGTRSGAGSESGGRHAGAAEREPAMRAGAGGDGKADEMIRYEERLRVGVEEQEVGHAHLRKTVETENVTTSVPVSHEEVRVVREPIREGDGHKGKISEAETEVTLHAERPVVRKETVPVERVRLETERVTETKEVSDTVRKEKIEFDNPKGDGMPGEERGRRGPRH